MYKNNHIENVSLNVIKRNDKKMLVLTLKLELSGRIFNLENLKQRTKEFCLCLIVVFDDIDCGVTS